jgi:hypothetical protein
LVQVRVTDAAKEDVDLDIGDARGATRDREGRK